jgi:hypothetical protein
MATFNPTDAVVYGLTSLSFAEYFAQTSGNGSNSPIYLSNDYATVYAFTSTSFPAGNAQAIRDLYPLINNPGPWIPYNVYTLNGLGAILYWEFPFEYTTAVVIAPANTTAVANLSISTLVGEETSPAANTSFTFQFIPGATQSITETYQTGTTISNTVTNGITNTNTTTTSTTETTGVTVTGTLPGASASVNQSVAQAWTQQEATAISYTNSETNTVNTNTTTSVIVNVDSATPNSSGQYVYTNSAGNTFTLVPGNYYVVEIQIDTTSYSTPVPNTYNIYGGNMTLVQSLFVTVTENVQAAINSANTYGYSQYSGVDPSNFSYETNPISQAVYTGLVSSASVTGTNASVLILPVATTATAASTPSTSATSTTTLSMMASPNVVDVTNLDLRAAAQKLSSSHGIYYNNIGLENELSKLGVEISGHDHASVKVGNLDYTLKNFSNSNISTGSGDNRVIINAKDINNSINLGSGNNEIDLNGLGNNIRMGDGANWVNVTGGTGKNFVIAGDGPTTLTFNSDAGFTQVSKWNSSEDAILFSPAIARSDVRVVFDSTNWSQDVYVNNKHVANILTTGGLMQADASSTVYSKTYAAPMPYNLESNEGFVSGLYVNAFSRASDSNGLSYWDQQLDSGASRKGVIQSFLTSNEYNDNHLSNSAFVSGVYQNVLGRQADTSGTTYWIGQLEAGASRVAVVGSFLAGAEFNNLVGAS